MEKRTPHCKLSDIKYLVQAEKVPTTYSAEQGAAQMGLNVTDMLSVILSLTSTDFYKSMTTHADHKVWQDVYRPSTSVGDVYLN